MTDKLKNLLLRLLNAIIWVPIVVCAAVIFTGYQHLLARILIIFFCFISGLEVGNLLKRKDPSLISWPVAFLSILIPILMMLHQEFPAYTSVYILACLLVLLALFSWEVFTYSDVRSSGAMSRLGSYMFAIIYPGLFFSFMMVLPMLDYPIATFSMFFFVTMLNDSFAYFIGLLWGRRTNTQGLALVSPKKSLVGFLGGITASIIAVLCYYYWIKPEIFGHRSVLYAIFMGFSCGIVGILGDLFESLIKRSVDVKDSGNFFLGRGGVLDSVDSLIFVAPVYYYFIAFAT